MQNGELPIGCSGRQIDLKLAVLTEHMIFLEALLKELVHRPEPLDMKLLTTQMTEEE